MFTDYVFLGQCGGLDANRAVGAFGRHDESLHLPEVTGIAYGLWFRGPTGAAPAGRATRQGLGTRSCSRWLRYGMLP